MKKTYITTMPDHIGAFLKASECFAALGINITRVSYNKAVDSHTLFIDAEGSPEQLEKANIELEKIGYLQTDKSDSGQRNKNSASHSQLSAEHFIHKLARKRLILSGFQDGLVR